MIVAGLAPSALLIGVAAFFFTFGTPILSACSQAIWQRKTAPEVQGRVFATRSMIATSSLPLAYLLTGPLADYVFGPLLIAGRPLAGSVGRVIGVGPGRGIALRFMVCGALMIVLAMAGFVYPRVQRLEDELPDVAALNMSAAAPLTALPES